MGAVLAPYLLACCASEPDAAIRFRQARDLAGSDPAAALEGLEGALAEWPRDDPEGMQEIRRWLVHACALAREPERGLEHAEAAIEAQPRDAWLRYAMGAALGELGRYDEALRSFTAALERDPEHVKSLEHRGSIEALLSRHEEAIADFERALAILEAKDPREVPEGRAGMLRSIRLQQADSLDALGRHVEAETERERALSSSP